MTTMSLGAWHSEDCHHSQSGDYLNIHQVHHDIWKRPKKESVAKLWLDGKKDELIGYHSALAGILSSLEVRVDRDVPMTLCRHATPLLSCTLTLKT